MFQKQTNKVATIFISFYQTASEVLSVVSFWSFPLCCLLFLDCAVHTTLCPRSMLPQNRVYPETNTCPLIQFLNINLRKTASILLHDIPHTVQNYSNKEGRHWKIIKANANCFSVSKFGFSCRDFLFFGHVILLKTLFQVKTIQGQHNLTANTKANKF